MLKKEHINIANLLSLSRIFLGLIFFGLFFLTQTLTVSPLTILGLQIAAFIVFIIGIITDGLDGYYARKHGLVSDFGKHFDPLTDSIFFIIVFCTFYYLEYMPFYFLLIIILREGFMHLFFRPFCKKKGHSLPANIYGKIKTFCQSIFSLFLLFLLILKQIFILYSWETRFLSQLTSLTAYCLFAVIAFLSLFSLIKYLVNMRVLFKS